MRYLGIDFGSKRVGLAVSDEDGAFAFPLSVLPNTPELVQRIKEVCGEKQIGEIIVGESKDFSQKENDIMLEVRPFVAELEKETGLMVRLHPEFLTSLEATRLQGENAMLDASAAALILKSYLDLQHNG